MSSAVAFTIGAVLGAIYPFAWIAVERALKAWRRR